MYRDSFNMVVDESFNKMEMQSKLYFEPPL